MSEKFSSTLKAWGLTPWQGVAGVAFVACWFTTLKPMPEAVAQLNVTVAELTTKVEVHAVVIGQLQRLTDQVNEQQRHIAILEGRLHAQVNAP